MNKKQKIAVCAGCFLMCCSILYPVWTMSIRGVETSNSSRFLYAKAYDFLREYANEVGKKEWDLRTFPKVNIDYQRMAAECGPISLITITIIALGRDKKDPKPS